MYVCKRRVIMLMTVMLEDLALFIDSARVTYRAKIASTLKLKLCFALALLDLRCHLHKAQNAQNASANCSLCMKCT